MFLAVAEASSRQLRVFCSDNWVSPLPSIIFRNPIIYRLGSNVRGQGTRHLVEGTLDPIVGCIFIMCLCLLDFQGL